MRSARPCWLPTRSRPLKAAPQAIAAPRSRSPPITTSKIFKSWPTASIASHRIAVPGLSPYCASKHGVLGLTKTAAVENARTGVRINAICPGTIDTPMLRSAMDGNPSMEKLILSASASGRLGEAAEVAETVVFLCSDRASFVSGESMLVDGATVAR